MDTVHGKIKFEFHSKIWQHNGQGGWHFVSLPQDLSKEVRDNLRSHEAGWGRLQATAKIANSTWETAIWYDTKKKTYLLPLKAAIRKQEMLKTGQVIEATIWV